MMLEILSLMSKALSQDCWKLCQVSLTPLNDFETAYETPEQHEGKSMIDAKI